MRDFKGEYPYMYVDTAGKVTVGVGHNLTDDYNALKTISFTVKRLERHKVSSGDKGISISSATRLNLPASYDEIVNDYNFLKNNSKLGTYTVSSGLMAKYTTLELSIRESDRLFEKDSKDAVGKCRKEFGPAFDTFPVSCQAVLMDIAFNVGNFIKYRPHFVAAIKGQGTHAGKSMSERWTFAAQHASRNVKNLKRDMTIKEWLKQGIAEYAAAEASSTMNARQAR